MTMSETKNRYVPVLNDGFVGLLDWLGSDQDIVNAARVSYAPLGSKKTYEEDRKLIRYLMRHRHTSPFEMAELKFHVRVPIYVWRQWIRHRTASVNEVSGRYTVLKESFHRLSADEWRFQSNSNRQGSDGYAPNDVGTQLSEAEDAFLQAAYKLYMERIDQGIAREQTRKDLPLSICTEAYWKIDLHNLLHFLELRLDAHAQFEIRQYAQVIANFVKELFPLTWEAFCDYRLNAITLSALEQRILGSVFVNSFSQLCKLIEDDTDLTEREKDELKAKIMKMQMHV